MQAPSCLPPHHPCLMATHNSMAYPMSSIASAGQTSKLTPTSSNQCSSTASSSSISSSSSTCSPTYSVKPSAVVSPTSVGTPATSSSSVSPSNRSSVAQGHTSTTSNNNTHHHVPHPHTPDGPALVGAVAGVMGGYSSVAMMASPCLFRHRSTSSMTSAASTSTATPTGGSTPITSSHGSCSNFSPRLRWGGSQILLVPPSPRCNYPIGDLTNIVFEVWENQRFYPLKGWSSALLPTDRSNWSDRSGQIVQQREAFLLWDEQWEWCGDWAVERSEHCDEDGWYYAIDFTQSIRSCSSQIQWNTMVRRRKWVRTMMRIRPRETDSQGLSSADGNNSSSVPGSDSASSLADTTSVSGTESDLATTSPHPAPTPPGGPVGSAMLGPSGCDLRTAGYEFWVEREWYGFPPSHCDERRAEEARYRVVWRQQQHTAWHAWNHYFATFKNQIINSKALKALVRQHGIPPTLRRRVWLEVSGAQRKLSENLGYYEKLLATHNNTLPESHADIEKDLMRTFALHPYFSEGGGRAAMRRVLTALAWRNPLIGYVQSFNYIVGFLLLNLVEEEAFWVLVVLMEDLLPNDFYNPQLTGMNVDCMVVANLVAELLPSLHVHLAAHTIDLSILSSNWLISLLVNKLPHTAAMRVWDILFVEGLSIIFRVILAFLRLHESAIIAEVTDTCGLLEVANQAFSMHDPTELLQAATRIRSKTPLSQLRARNREILLARLSPPEVHCAEALDSVLPPPATSSDLSTSSDVSLDIIPRRLSYFQKYGHDLPPVNCQPSSSSTSSVSSTTPSASSASSSARPRPLGQLAVPTGISSATSSSSTSPVNPSTTSYTTTTSGAHRPLHPSPRSAVSPNRVASPPPATKLPSSTPAQSDSPHSPPSGDVKSDDSTSEVGISRPVANEIEEGGAKPSACALAQTRKEHVASLDSMDDPDMDYFTTAEKERKAMHPITSEENMAENQVGTGPLSPPAKPIAPGTTTNQSTSACTVTATTAPSPTAVALSGRRGSSKDNVLLLGRGSNG